jgi:hypothetical protein
MMTMTLLVVARILVAVTTMVCRAWSFSPISTYNNHPIIHLSLPTTPASSRLFSLIKGEAYGSEPFDENEGGVGLAKRCAVKIVGGRSVGGNAIEAQELYRYERLTPLDKSEIANSIAEGKYGDIQLLCSGMGKEDYVDPGSSYRVEDKVIKLAPIEAVKNALSSIAKMPPPTIDSKKSLMMVFNFLGGDELIIGEVLMACDMLVEGLNLPATTKVKFNSISHVDVPSELCHVTVVAVGGGALSSSSSSSEEEDIDESVGKGELYDRDGTWFTVARRDMITN